MRKLLLLSICIGVFVADCGAFAATARSSRGSSAAAGDSAPVAARAAAVRSANKTNTTATSSVARAAKKQTASVSGSTLKSTPVAGKTTAARAGAKQKVINMGTKVSVATANTVVSKECQDAYFGCMDSFCMMDNVSGGRCQCSDRNEELNAVLLEIMRLNEETELMATEGVERLKMGENAEEIIARAEAAAKAVNTTSQDRLANGSTKEEIKQTIDFSSWKSSIFDDDDLEEEIEVDTSGDLSTKKGDVLYASAVKICRNQISTTCKASGSMLQMMYAQQVKANCTAYENSLRQQQSESTQNLQAAKKALREAALEQFQTENKYDLGGCTVAFKECMQETAGCGEDFSGCIADVVTLNIGRNQTVSTQTISTGSTSLKINSMTYDILNAKRPMCESVLKSCVKVADGVWDAFLRDIAPTVRIAEVNAESDRRMSCVSTVSDCVRKSCGSQWDEKSDNYDMCLSDPNSVKQFCSIEMEKCGDSSLTGAIMTYVSARLNSMRVDRCTTQVKDCLQNENVCGTDYAGCVGLSADSILSLCPVAKLTACMDKFDETTARDYVVKIAQGVALNMENLFAQQCQNAVNAATIKVCGDENDCSSIIVSPDALVDAVFNYKVCDGNPVDIKTNCVDTAEALSSEDIEKALKKKKKYHVNLTKVNLPGYVTLGPDENNKLAFIVGEGLTRDEEKTAVELLTNNMNQNLNMVVSSISDDSTVKACLEGRTFEGFKDASGKTAFGESVQPFPNLMDNIKNSIASQLYKKIMNRYTERLKEIQDKRDEDEMLLVSKYAQSKVEREEACKQMAADLATDMDALKVTASAVYYDKGNDGKGQPQCVITIQEWFCNDWHTSNGRCDTDSDDSGRKTYTRTCNMITGKCEKSGSTRYTEG